AAAINAGDFPRSLPRPPLPGHNHSTFAFRSSIAARHVRAGSSAAGAARIARSLVARIAATTRRPAPSTPARAADALALTSSFARAPATGYPWIRSPGRHPGVPFCQDQPGGPEVSRAGCFWGIFTVPPWVPVGLARLQADSLVCTFRRKRTQPASAMAAATIWMIRVPRIDDVSAAAWASLMPERLVRVKQRPGLFSLAGGCAPIDGGDGQTAHRNCGLRVGARRVGPSGQGSLADAARAAP